MTFKNSRPIREKTNANETRNSNPVIIMNSISHNVGLKEKRN